MGQQLVTLKITVDFYPANTALSVEHRIVGDLGTGKRS